MIQIDEGKKTSTPSVLKCKGFSVFSLSQAILSLQKRTIIFKMVKLRMVWLRTTENPLYFRRGSNRKQQTWGRYNPTEKCKCVRINTHLRMWIKRTAEYLPTIHGSHQSNVLLVQTEFIEVICPVEKLLVNKLQRKTISEFGCYL
jgi:hypothetical protein